MVFKARRCFNCLGAHLVKDCTQRCDCLRCQGSDICKHFFLLHEYFMLPLYLRVLGIMSVLIGRKMTTEPLMLINVDLFRFGV